MKKLFFFIIISIFLILSLSIAVLSISGYETNRFNNIISKKINENNRYVTVSLKKIKFKFDYKDISLFVETKNPKLNYQNLDIPIEDIKVYIKFLSLFKSNIQIDKINITTKNMNINQLKKIIIKSKPSNLNSLIINKVTKGNLVTNIELFLDKNLKIKNFIATGNINNMNVEIKKNLILDKTSFTFFADATDILIKNIKSSSKGIVLNNGTLKIEKNEKIVVKSDFSTITNINKDNISNYLTLIKNLKYLNENISFTTNINHNLDYVFDKTLKILNFSYKSKGLIEDLKIVLNKKIKSDFLKDDINTINFQNTNFNLDYNFDRKNSLSLEGKYNINDSKYKNFNLKNNFSKSLSNMVLNFDFSQNLNFNLINYEKKKNLDANIFLDLSKSKDTLSFNKINYKENKNRININKLKIKNDNLISIKNITVKTFENGELNNDFNVSFDKKIKIIGATYDASNLSRILNKRSGLNPFKQITKEITIDFENIDFPMSKKLFDFRLIGSIEKGKFIKISSKGDFGDDKYLDISLKNDKKSKKKYLEIYSDSPQPLLSEYSFFKGVSEGTLLFSSIIQSEDLSTSKLVIENFKVVNAPGVAKLLSLADFGGLADLAEGEGLSFDKLEIKMNKNKDFLKLEELYAVGPSISVLMEGYRDANEITSLRGTLVPAKNLNKFLSKIPVIGDIIIPKDIGEGLFGVSFKMKGPPGKIKTSINPIKTLTPRFITKALEKSK